MPACLRDTLSYIEHVDVERHVVTSGRDSRDRRHGYLAAVVVVLSLRRLRS
jgi:hypothetical protein